MYSTTKDDGFINTMSNFEIILKNYLRMFCSDIYGERSFSKLKHWD